MGHRPPGKCDLDLGPTCAPYERSPALRPHEQQHGGTGRGHRGHFSTHRLALDTCEVMERSGVQDQPEAMTNTRRLQGGDVAMDEAHLDAGLADPGAGALQGLLHTVDPRDLPAALRELDAPDPAARSEIQCRSEGGLAAGLLAREQFRRLRDERRISGGVLPRVEADRIGESPVPGRAIAARYVPSRRRSRTGRLDGRRGLPVSRLRCLDAAAG